ncbi:MAG: hypothetical protein C0600_16410 [Ignavibacteria bacterium]|nr:MAG: hypothetical protein C0600_16410 [Ignavibacteria bacterium]
MKRFIPLFIVLIVVAGCGSDVADELTGTWKNGDGNLLRFTDEGLAYRGQEGYDDEGESTFEVRGDSVIVTTEPDEAGGPSNMFHLFFARDTLYLISITLQRPGEERTIPLEEFALQLGRPASKFHFTRMEEQK